LHHLLSVCLAISPCALLLCPSTWLHLDVLLLGLLLHLALLFHFMACCFVMPWCFVLHHALLFCFTTCYKKIGLFLYNMFGKLKGSNALIWLNVFGKLKGKLSFDAKTLMF
jgi:hypothetical protein